MSPRQVVSPEDSARLTPKTPEEVKGDLLGFARLNEQGETFTGAGNLQLWLRYGYVTTPEHFEIIISSLEKGPKKDETVAQTLMTVAVERMKDEEGPHLSENASNIVGRALVVLRKMQDSHSDGGTQIQEKACACEEEVCARIGELQSKGGRILHNSQELENELMRQLAELRQSREEAHSVMEDAVDISEKQNHYPFDDAELLAKRNPAFKVQGEKFIAGSDPRCPTTGHLYFSLWPTYLKGMEVGSLSLQVYCHTSPVHDGMVLPPVPPSNASSKLLGPLYYLPITPQTIPAISGVNPGNGFESAESISRFHSPGLDTFSRLFALDFALTHLSPRDQNGGARYVQLKEGIVEAGFKMCEAYKECVEIREILEGKSEWGRTSEPGLRDRAKIAESEAEKDFKNSSPLDKVKWLNNIENSPQQKTYRALKKELDETEARLRGAEDAFTGAQEGYANAHRALGDFINSEPAYTDTSVGQLVEVYNRMEAGTYGIAQADARIMVKIHETLRALERLRKFQDLEVSGTVPVVGTTSGKITDVTPEGVINGIAHFKVDMTSPERVAISGRTAHIVGYIAELTESLEKSFKALQEPGAALKPGAMDPFKELAEKVLSYRRQFLPSVEEAYMRRHSDLEERAEEALGCAEEHFPQPAKTGTTLGSWVLGQGALGAGSAGVN